MGSGAVAFLALNKISMKTLLTVIIVLSQIISLAQSKEVVKQNINMPYLVNFSDSIVIENPVVIDFFKEYLNRFEETPIVVCHFNNYNDSLSLTLAGYSDSKSIFGMPIGYMKIGERYILMDFGIKQLINQKVCNGIISKLKLTPTSQEITEKGKLICYFFPSWQLTLYKDGRYAIHKGVMPPNSPPSLKSSSDTAKVFYRPHTH